MAATGRHLHLVFNEDGDNPLVLESSWTGSSPHAPPNLTNVRARKMLRALSIFLILAKYEQNSDAADQTEILFKIQDKKYKDGTWIFTLVDKYSKTEEWLLKCFHIIKADDLFMFGKVGSMHNLGGKEPPQVKYFPDRLSLDNLHLFARHLRPTGSTKRLLQKGELLDFAFKLEEGHWRKPIVKKLYPEHFGGNDPKERQTKLALRAIKNNDPLERAFIESANAIEQKATREEWKARLTLLFEWQIERELAKYRKNCEPFFEYVGDSLTSARIPYAWQKPTWNQGQIETLFWNCCYYASFCHSAIQNLAETGGHFKDTSFTGNIWHYYKNKIDVVSPAFDILCKWAVSSGLVYGQLGSCSSVQLKQAEEVKRLLSSGLQNANRSIAVGVFFAQQIILIDFLNEVCWPLCPPGNSPFTKLPSVVVMLKWEAAINKNVCRSFCEEPRDFLDALQAARALLKAQADFWNALHRRLVLLGG